jgi:hypothetical protein
VRRSAQAGESPDVFVILFSEKPFLQKNQPPFSQDKLFRNVLQRKKREQDSLIIRFSGRHLSQAAR